MKLIAPVTILIKVLCIALLIPLSAYTQTYPEYPWHVNANLGATLLFGDLQSANSLTGRIPDDLDLGFGIRAGRNVSPIFAIYLQGVFGKFSGANSSRQLEYNSSFNELGLGLRGSVTDLIFGKKDRFFNMYGFGGGSMVIFRSEAIDTKTGEVISDFGYSDDAERKKSNPETGVVFPLGVGFDLRLNQKLFITLDAGFRVSLTDKLDALIRGAQEDAYYYSSFGVSYYFNLGKPGLEKHQKEITPPVDIPEIADHHIDLKYILPSELQSYDEFRMRSIVHKGAIDGKAQLIQILPIGFMVLDTAISSASRTEFSNYTLRLYWDELPQDTAFEVSYDVKLDQVFGTLPMSSILYLDKTGKEYRFKTDVMVKRKILEDLFAELEDADVDIGQINANVDLVEFKIQVSASFRQRISIQSLEDKFNLKGLITEEVDGSWYKYTVGSYSTYQKARQQREVMIKDHKVAGAFLVAYYKGTRLGQIKELIAVAPEFYPLPFDSTLTKRSPYCYRVQILALRDTEVTPASLKSKWGLDEVVNEEVYHTWRKYTVGDCLTKQGALKLTDDLIDKGINGAFPVLYKDGERSAGLNP